MKTTKITLIPIFILLFVQANVFAQQGQGRNMKTEQNEKIETQRIAFITDKLALTPEEAEKFWPVYNEHKKRVQAERKAFKQSLDFDHEKIFELSDEKANEIIQSQLKHEQKMLDTRKSFHLELLDILSPQKVLRLFEAEKEFRVELMHRVAGREERMHRNRNR
jgi:hypothetical protein